MARIGPESAYIFRITHIDNVPWILDHGIHCGNSDTQDPHFVPIGSPELIQKRASHPVPIDPGGTLGDYVPFYFTPWSIMLFNIKTGHNNVIKQPNGKIVILVSSLPRLQEVDARFVFTNGHAYLKETDYFDDPAALDRIDWKLIQAKDFKRDNDDPGKLGRYQAEALVHGHVPISGLLGIACYDSAARQEIEHAAKARTLPIKVETLPSWYFP